MFFKNRKCREDEVDPNSKFVDVKNIKVAQHINVKDLIDSEINEIKEQMHNYGEICDVLTTKTINPDAYMDKLNILLQSFKFSVVSLCLVNDHAQLEFFSRGYKEELSEELTTQWQSAVDMESNSIDWVKLLAHTQNENSFLNDLLVKENLGRIGFSPIEERGFIFGFIFVGSKVGDETSIFASSCLETFGSRLGLILRYNLERKECRDIFVNYRNNCHESIDDLNKKLLSLKENLNNNNNADALRIVEECQDLSDSIRKM